MKLSAHVAIALVLLLPIQEVLAQSGEVELLSAPNLTTGGDRIVAFDLKASDCTIRSLPKVPAGWFLSITNDASGRAEVRGNAQVGAASLAAGYFLRFVGIQRQSQEKPISNIALEIVVTKDFIHERHMAVSPTGLTLSKEPS